MLFDGERVNEKTPEERRIAQVFQFPVVYDTMTVYGNLAFPLRNRGFDKAYIDKRVREVAQILELEPFLKNENFRQAIKDFNESSFKSHDRRIRDDVTFLMTNLCEKSKYTQQGAKEICIYVIDNELAKKFAK